MKINIDPDAIPRAAPTPKHWERKVKETLIRDTRLGVLGKTPICVRCTWVHCMAVVVKTDGSCSRVVDLSILNTRKPPFNQVCKIPVNTWKSMTNVWNGFHFVPLGPEVAFHNLFTTFVTPCGKYFYRVTPQSYLAGGDS